MKLVNYCLLLLGCWLGMGRGAWCQCATSPNDPTAFYAFDTATGQVVNALCVGRTVLFRQRAGRNNDSLLVSYGVKPGNQDFFPGCNPTNYSHLYTPTAAEVGMVTVSELSTPKPINGVPAPPTYYTRPYQVYGTPPPAFTVAPCPNGFVSVLVTDAIYDSYTAQVGAGSSVPVPRGLATTVATAGGTSVTLTGHYAANGLCTGANTLPIPTLAPAQTPLFSSLTLLGPLPGGAATLAVGQLPAGYLYTLQLDTGTGFQRVADVAPGTASIALPAPAAGCYRVLRTDACGNNPAPSAVICTLSLRGASAQNRNQLLLSDAGNPNAPYSVLRNNQPLTSFTLIAGGLEDADVQCGTTYTYVVKATQANGSVAVSNPVSIRTQSSLAPSQPRLKASINDHNVVVLTPLLANPLAPGSSLRYLRAAGGLPPVAFGMATSAVAPRDSVGLAALLAAPPCYSVRLTDVCGNTSTESPPACPALLTVRAADPDGTTAALTWTPFSGPTPGAPVSYTLQRLAPDGTVLSSGAVSGTSFTDLMPSTTQQVLRYRLQIGGGGLAANDFSYSNVTTLTRQLALTIPTAFTPNGDGLNDVLEVKGKYLNNYTFVVVDRNGQQVFRGTQRSETWDGRINGQAPVLGVYVWRFQQNEAGGQPFTATGSITILK